MKSNRPFRRVLQSKVCFCSMKLLPVYTVNLRLASYVFGADCIASFEKRVRAAEWWFLLGYVSAFLTDFYKTGRSSSRMFIYYIHTYIGARRGRQDEAFPLGFFKTKHEPLWYFKLEFLTRNVLKIFILLIVVYLSLFCIILLKRLSNHPFVNTFISII